jgi:phage terminase large subunit-like protein
MAEINNLAKMDEADLREYFDYFSEKILGFATYFLKQFLINEVPPFHQEIYDILPKNKRLLIISPRGFAKSTICSVIYVLWIAVFKKAKDILIISSSETLAVEWLRKIKMEIETNEKIRLFFGDLISKKWSETHIILANGVNIRARGAGAAIRGFRPECIVLDDIETDEEVESEEQRKKLKNWLFKACLNTLTPTGQLVIVGTILHPLSVLNDLFFIDNGWEKRRFQAYRNAKQEEGYELWPQLWPHKRLQIRKKEIGTFAFASEFMNDPVADEAAPIKPHMIREWKELPQQYSAVIVLDPAYSEEESADYKVAALIGIDQNQNRYLISYIRTHGLSGEFIDAALNLFLANKGVITGFGIPCGGTEKEFYRSVVNRANERKVYPPFVELKNVFTTVTGESKRNKKSRIIAALQPLFESGKYYIAPSHIEARDELLTIGSSRWDDVVDTMAYAEQVLQPMYYEKEPKSKSPWANQTKTEAVNYGYN